MRVVLWLVWGFVALFLVVLDHGLQAMLISWIGLVLLGGEWLAERYLDEQPVEKSADAKKVQFVFACCFWVGFPGSLVFFTYQLVLPLTGNWGDGWARLGNVLITFVPISYGVARFMIYQYRTKGVLYEFMVCFWETIDAIIPLPRRAYVWLRQPHPTPRNGGIMMLRFVRFLFRLPHLARGLRRPRYSALETCPGRFGIRGAGPDPLEEQ